MVAVRLGAGMVGAREGQKGGRKGRTLDVIIAEDGGEDEGVDVMLAKCG